MNAIATLWKREVLRFLKSKPRIIGSLGTPFFFLLILGNGLSNVIALPGGVNYTQFMAPGIIAMVLLFASIFNGITVITDRQFGFLKEILVAPVKRYEIVLGRSLGGATTAMIQAVIILIIAIIMGIPLATSQLFFALALMLLTSTGFVALGIAIASKMEDVHGFQLIVNFFLMPLFFLSGALFPLDKAPEWLSTAAGLNPLTYAVEGLRFAFIGQSRIDPILASTALAIFTIASLAVATILFNQKE